MTQHIETRFTRDYKVRHPVALAPWPSSAPLQTLRLLCAGLAD